MIARALGLTLAPTLVARAEQGLGRIYCSQWLMADALRRCSRLSVIWGPTTVPVDAILTAVLRDP